jgi:hypothetical protein
MGARPLCDSGFEPGENGHSPRTASRWSAIADRTVYFGHQSVGSGVIAGVEELRAEHALPLRIVQTRDPATVAGPAFVHFLAGQNRDYASKNASLLRLLESRTRAQRPVVVLKYCYADITCPADTITMFEAYCDTVDTIQFEHPDVSIVHTTIPLTTVETTFKWRSKQFLGRPTRREAAVARHRYNELVRAEFSGAEPIFDLAKVESLRPDGMFAGFSVGGCMVETLAPHNTYDGGHLNVRCQKAAAEALLDVLSDVIEAKP